MPTTPLGVFYPAGTDGYDLTVDLAAMATSVDGAITGEIGSIRPIQTYKWADSVARAAQLGMTEGDFGWQIDTNTYYVYSGSAWVVQQGSDDTGWTAATLQNSWVAFGGGHVTPGYRRIGSRVEFRGTAKSGTVATVFTLPTGYRPAYDLYYNVMANGGTAQLSVSASTGNVTVVAYVSPATNAILSLQGVSFYTD